MGIGAPQPLPDSNVDSREALISADSKHIPTQRDVTGQPPVSREDGTVSGSREGRITGMQHIMFQPRTHPVYVITSQCGPWKEFCALSDLFFLSGEK